MTDYARAWERWFPIIERGVRALSECMLDNAGLGNGSRVLDIEPASASRKSRRYGES